NYKEKKLGAKYNLKKEEELKNQGIFEDEYRYPATWYRYPRRQAHTKSRPSVNQ
ncbi:hypothetical protein PIB30_107111, partial [Stylosanthes scabra]|nr:hypothetical protein [Stylosanthes scabra]